MDGTGAPRKIILDCDPGIDDALAVVFALRSPELQVEAITTVAGNVLIEPTTANARGLVDLAGTYRPPVAMGAARPLSGKLLIADFVHGANGLGGVDLETSVPLDRRGAVGLMAETICRHPGEITLVAVGPLTNVAMLLREEPSRAAELREIILMGGSFGKGNTTPVAEFNIYSDPLAAKEVLASGIPITMLTLEATSQAVLQREHLDELRSSPEASARTIAAFAEPYINFVEDHGPPGAPLHDPLAVGVAIDPTLALETAEVHVDVETAGELTRGQTVATWKLKKKHLTDCGDHYRVTGWDPVRPNVRVPTRIDGLRLVRLLMDRLTGPPPQR